MTPTEKLGLFFTMLFIATWAIVHVEDVPGYWGYVMLIPMNIGFGMFMFGGKRE